MKCGSLSFARPVGQVTGSQSPEGILDTCWPRLLNTFLSQGCFDRYLSLAPGHCFLMLSWIVSGA